VDRSNGGSQVLAPGGYRTQNRGAQDIFIACMGGLKGFPEAIESVHTQTAVQLCVLHMVRHSLN